MGEESEINAQLKQAQGFVRQGKYAQAIELCREILKEDDRLIPAYECLAAAGFMSKDYDLAIENFKRISVMKPRDAACLVNLGAVYNRLEDYNKAMNSLRQAIQRDRNCSEAHYNLGLAYRGLNQSAMAVSAYRDAVRLKPDMVEGFVNLANVYFEMKNYQQAIIHYHKALELNPDSKRAQRGLKNAEEISDEQKNIANPFGRLVDAETAASALKKTVARSRQLTESERLRDRNELVNLSSTIERESSELHIGLGEELASELVELDRCLAEGVAAPTAFAKEIDRFQSILESCQQSRNQLCKKLEQLRFHEQTIAEILKVD